MEDRRNDIDSLVTSIQVFTAKIDERVTFLISNQVSIENSIRDLTIDQKDIVKRLIILESKNLDRIVDEIRSLHDNDRLKIEKLSNLESKIEHMEAINNSWVKVLVSIADICMKVTIGCGAGFLLYKLGINPSFLK